MTSARDLAPVLLFCAALGAPLAVAEAGPEAAPAPAATQRPAAPKDPGAKKESVLDFEGELIEGSRSAPELFLQQDMGSLSIDTMIYERDDFNEFHKVDRKRRPRHFDGGARK